MAPQLSEVWRLSIAGGQGFGCRGGKFQGLGSSLEELLTVQEGSQCSGVILAPKFSEAQILLVMQFGSLCCGTPRWALNNETVLLSPERKTPKP